MCQLILTTSIYHFVDSCIAAEEYKRAVAVLEYLSTDGDSQVAFCVGLAETLLERGKTARVEEVLSFMRSRGGELAKSAEELLVKWERGGT